MFLWQKKQDIVVIQGQSLTNIYSFALQKLNEVRREKRLISLSKSEAVAEIGQALR